MTANNTGLNPVAGVVTQLDNVNTAEEAMVQAGMNWQVAMKDLYILDKQGTYHLVPGRKACTRRDTGDVFGVFSPQYTPFQWSGPTGTFAFMDECMPDGGVYHQAGVTRGGARGFLKVKLPGTLRVNERDWLTMSIMLVDSYDGTSAFTIRPDLVRACCSNQFAPKIRTLAESAAGSIRDRMMSTIKIVHKGDVVSKLRAAQEVMALQESYFLEVLRKCQFLAQERAPDMEAFLVDLFGQQEHPEAIGVRVRNQMDAVDRVYREDGVMIDTSRWGVYNAVTQWVDHERGYRSLKDPVEARSKRLEAAWFGSGAELKQRAWDLLTV